MDEEIEFEIILKKLRFKIMNLCASSNISLNELALRSGMTQSTLSNLINGYSKNPKLFTISKVINGLNITLSEFFYEIERDDYFEAKTECRKF